MRNLMILVVLVAVGIAGLGFYRGWFAVSTNNAEQSPSATFNVDKAKIREDEQKAKDDLHRFGQEAKKKIDNVDGKVKEPQPQP